LKFILFVIALLVLPHSVHGAAFWSDGFESAASFSSYDTTCDGTDLTADPSTYAGASSTNSWVRFYAQGGTDSGPDCVANRLAGSTLPDHFIIAYDFKVLSGFDWGTGHKMMRIMTDMNTGLINDHTEINFQLNTDGKVFTIENFAKDGGTTFETTCFQTAMGASPTVDTWHRVVWRVQRNSSSSASDGWVEVYLDGTMRGSRCANMRLTRTSNWLADFWGGPGNRTSIGDPIPSPGNTMRVDNLLVYNCATDDCDGYSTATAGSSAPAAPTNFKAANPP